jgi:hypothetical protein
LKLRGVFFLWLWESGGSRVDQHAQTLGMVKQITIDAEGELNVHICQTFCA